MSFVHIPVLLEETISAFADAPKDGVFVDGTFGRGGHSQALLKTLDKDARLIVFDKDPRAIEAAYALAQTDARVFVVHDSFANIAHHLAVLDIKQADGMMADLGVSSPQLDDASRGFSFMKAGALDMRMNPNEGQSVCEVLQCISEEALANVLYTYGEERYARRIAHAIKQKPRYECTLELAQTIKNAHPKWQKGKHPATKSFQALRIYVNRELEDLDAFLNASIDCLKCGGVLAVIAFHSLEDRQVKQFLNAHSKGYEKINDPFLSNQPKPKYFNKPARIDPSADEIGSNPRARSSHLRIATRTEVIRG